MIDVFQVLIARFASFSFENGKHVKLSHSCLIFPALVDKTIENVVEIQTKGESQKSSNFDFLDAVADFVSYRRPRRRATAIGSDLTNLGFWPQVERRANFGFRVLAWL